MTNETLTNEQGIATLTGVLEGELPVTISKEGYQTVTKTLVVGSGSVDFEANMVQMVELTLYASDRETPWGYEATISAIPLAYFRDNGININDFLDSFRTDENWDRTSVAYTTSTDSEGKFEIPDEDWLLLAEDEMTHQGITIDIITDVQYTKSAGVSGDLLMQNQREYIYEITVLDGNDEPIAGVSINRLNVTTTKKGEATHRITGTISCTFTKEGYKTMTSDLLFDKNHRTYTIVLVPADREEEEEAE